MNIHILGAGVLTRLIIEVIESNPHMNVAGIYDDGYPNVENVFDYKILGKIDQINPQTPLNLAIGVGDPNFRKKIFLEKQFKTCHFPTLIHRTALISKYSQIGKGVIIGPFTSVLNNSCIGDGCCILSHVNINQDVTIEKFCLIGSGSLIGNSVCMGEGCHLTLGSKVMLNESLVAWSVYK